MSSGETQGPISESPSPPKNKIRHVAMLIFSLLLVVAAGFIFFRELTPHPVAARKLPRFGAPGQIIPVQIKVNRKGTESGGFIIKDRLPPGWRLVASLPPPAAGEAADSEVKWLIPGGSSPVSISYTVRVNPDTLLNSDAGFTGSMVGRAEGFSRTEIIGGDQAVKVAGIHWADTNGDGRIDDDEIMPAYYLTEEMKGLGLDWKTVEAIWSAKGYKWDREKKEFVLIK